jgi:hypothetical protein
MLNGKPAYTASPLTVPMNKNNPETSFYGDIYFTSVNSGNIRSIAYYFPGIYGNSPPAG